MTLDSEPWHYWEELKISLGGTRTDLSRTLQRKCHINEGYFALFRGLALDLSGIWEVFGKEKSFLAGQSMSL